MEKKYENPKVSICIPFFNQENYVKDTLDSVFSQTYDNYEVIIRDDASTDSTVKMIKKYFEESEINPNINYYVLNGETNVGVVENFNIMFKKAKGDFIALQGGDDISLPDRIEESIYLIEKYKRDLIAVDATGINDKKEVLFNSFYENALHNEYFYKNIESEVQTDADGKKNIFFSPSKKYLQCKDCMGGFGILFRKEILATYEYKLPNTILYEDRFLTFLALCGKGFIQYNKQLVLYRRNDDNYSMKSARTETEKYLEVLRINQLTLPVIKEQIRCLEKKLVNLEKDMYIKIIKALQTEEKCCKFWIKSIQGKESYEKKTSLIFNICISHDLSLKTKIEYIVMFFSPIFTKKNILKQYDKREKTFYNK